MQNTNQHSIPRQLTIEIISGYDDGKQFPLELKSSAPIVTIGRDHENDVALPHDASVSREHAVLSWTNQGWRLEDCQSRNGTFIEADDLFQPDVATKVYYPLLAGTPFRIGKTWLIIRGYE
ncbi:MAG: FHA domain-containing protein [Phototrophicaceae bacterium]